jgi:hypothetical protein
LKQLVSRVPGGPVLGGVVLGDGLAVGGLDVLTDGLGVGLAVGLLDGLALGEADGEVVGVAPGVTRPVMVHVMTQVSGALPWVIGQFAAGPARVAGVVDDITGRALGVAAATPTEPMSRAMTPTAMCEA